ncbi:MAG: glucosaminidase domain-containing protein [Phycisphaerae bacterium]|nr:glucosaminidase domain-containing protein [Saprospiraceae bacterium]
MQPQTDQNGGCLQAFGRGSFIALLLVAIPCFLVLRYRTEIEAKISGLSEMPVYQQLTDDFKTGAELAGSTFAAELRKFYADSTLRVPSEILPKRKSTYWRRDRVEAQLKEKLGRRYQAGMSRYLDYVEHYRDFAELEMRRSKIPASVTLAQGILETNAGQSILATRGNNHFGIKCRARPGFRRDGVIDDRDFDPHSLAVDCMQMHDDYAWDRFEVYPSARESFRRHTLLLQDRRYGWMLHEYEVGGIYPIKKTIFGHDRVPYYAAWCVGLKQSGYATARLYAEKLTLIIETYQLWKIDYEAVIR